MEGIDLKPLVFISHIHTEADVAIWLKDQLTQLLLGGVEFFVSSDKTSIVAGDRWLRNIEDGVKNATVVIVLCSARSIERPWINFEAGGAWFSGKRVIPLCHGSFFPSSLPEPLKSLQGLSISSPEDFHDLVALLASEAGLLTPTFDVHAIVGGAPNIEHHKEEPLTTTKPTQPPQQSLDELFKTLQSVVVALNTDGRLSASGFVCDLDGHILTADYAVEENGNNITVNFNDGTSHRAEVVATDQEYGLALLRIPFQSESCINVNSAPPNLFTDVITLGPKKHVGLITASGRITGKSLNSYGRAQLQTQLKISPGFGGAPVIAYDGQFVGMVHSSLRDDDTTFLAPAECCKAFIERVTESGP